MTFDIGAAKNSDHHTAGDKRVLHHYLRVHEQDTVHILHRIGLENNVNKRRNGEHNSHQCENIDKLFISADLGLHLADD